MLLKSVRRIRERLRERTGVIHRGREENRMIDTLHNLRRGKDSKDLTYQVQNNMDRVTGGYLSARIQKTRKEYGKGLPGLKEEKRRKGIKGYVNFDKFVARDKVSYLSRISADLDQRNHCSKQLKD